jgi:hypothetical protein
MLRFARVGGQSMSPTLEDGDFVLALAAPWLGRVRCGDVVLVRHRRLGLIVKRVVHLDHSGWLKLAGDSAASCSSESMGRVQRRAVLGRAVLRIAPRGSGNRMDRAAHRPRGKNFHGGR